MPYRVPFFPSVWCTYSRENNYRCDTKVLIFKNTEHHQDIYRRDVQYPDIYIRTWLRILK